MTWAVLDNYGFEVVEVIRETDKTVTYRNQRWEGTTRAAVHNVFPFRGDEAAARRVAAEITAAHEEYWNLRRTAGAAFEARKAEILAKAGKSQ